MSEQIAKPRKPRAKPLTMSERFDLMALVKSASTSLSDRALAAQASEKFGRAVSAQAIAGYRKQFGIASVPGPTREQLQARIAQLEKRLEELTAVPA